MCTSRFSDPDYGLGEASLNNIEVLVIFSHFKNEDLPDSVAKNIVQRVKKNGMGLVVLHSAHTSKPFKMLMHSSGEWKNFNEQGGVEKVKILLPKHPIAKHIKPFLIPATEMYQEPLDVPQPDSVIMEGSWPSFNNTSREVMTWTVGKGRVVYIRAGHETYPIYFMSSIQQIIFNAIQWANHKKT